MKVEATGSMMLNGAFVIRMNCLRSRLFVASLVAVTAPNAAAAADAPLPEAIATVVRGSVVASNADSPSAVASYFTPAPIIVDEIAPYQWTGPHAAERWWMTIDRQNRKYGIPKSHFAMGTVKRWHMHGDDAYVVVPLTLTYTAQGEAGRVDGQWALTLRRPNGHWKITAAAWAEE